MSETNEQKRVRDAAAESSVLEIGDETPMSPTNSEASMPVTHAHVHEHADGTVHSHYHTHPGGDVAHEHAAASHDEIAFDQGSEAHAYGAIPEHSHATTTSIKPPLEACDLAYAYPHQEHSVFSGLSFHVHPASMLAILGNNGAGKSTLLDLLAGITKPTAGRVLNGGGGGRALPRKGGGRRHASGCAPPNRPPLLGFAGGGVWGEPAFFVGGGAGRSGGCFSGAGGP